MEQNKNSRRNHKRNHKLLFVLLFVTTFILMTCPAFAANGADISKIIKDVLEQVIYPIFTAIGVILAAYGVGALVLAFKNGDPEGQARATQALVAAIALIGVRVMIDNLHLTDYI